MKIKDVITSRLLITFSEIFVNIKFPENSQSQSLINGQWVGGEQCLFCDGMSRYGIPENLTTG